MKSEVVGSGLLASAFMKSKSQNCLFFCSGVSNSQETRRNEFDREKSLLLKNISTEKFFVYFSSVLAGTQDSDYYRHKIEMENLIADNCDKYLIFRLPQVAGAVNNGTLLPTFIKKIINNEEITVYKNAQRCIVDVEHVVNIFDHAYNDGLNNVVLNCCPEYVFNPAELISILSIYLRREVSVILIEKDSIQQAILSPLLKKYEYIFGDIDSYLQRVVQKYVQRILDLV